VNWQVVNLSADYTDWLDAPILYVASNQPLKFSDADVAKLRNFANAGGLLFTQADNSTEIVNRSIVDLAHKVFPDYEFTDVPADHELYTCNYQIKTPRPKLKM